MINPIRIVIHDFPKVFSVVINTFIVTFDDLKSKCLFLVKEKTSIENFDFIKAFAKFKIKDQSIIHPDLYIKPNLYTSGKSQSFYNSNVQIEAHSSFQANPKSELKSFTKLNSIVAIFLRWTDRKLETWKDVESVTNKQFILREIK